LFFGGRFRSSEPQYLHVTDVAQNQGLLKLALGWRFPRWLVLAGQLNEVRMEARVTFGYVIDDKWLRLQTQASDLITVPTKIYSACSFYV
jgi:hypothetical protein